MPAVTLRPETDADLPFLRALYASTREAEMRLSGWPPAQQAAFLRGQFEAQRAQYRQSMPDARFDIVEIDGAPAGRLYVDERPDDVRLVDIALLPEYRDQGIGRSLIEVLIEQAGDRPVTFHVFFGSPAIRLYYRLGFTFRHVDGAYLLLERLPQAQPPLPLTHTDFEPHLHTPFTMPVPGGDLTLTLTSVTVLPDQGAGDERTPFSLIFAGPKKPLIPQATYLLQHEAMDDIAIFIVPIASSETSIEYEAVFN
ncbi:MAG: N-acetyltransferase [Bacteroidota bacterium]